MFLLSIPNVNIDLTFLSCTLSKWRTFQILIIKNFKNRKFSQNLKRPPFIMVIDRNVNFIVALGPDGRKIHAKFQLDKKIVRSI